MTSPSAARPTLITGATGMTGAHIMKLLLREGHTDIRAVRRPTSRMELVAQIAGKVKWIEGDIRDPVFVHEATKNIDTIIHSAALISHDPDDRQAMHEINFRGTRQLINASLANGVRRFLHVSSIAVFKREGSEQHIDEDAGWDEAPSSDYALTKHLAEMEVWRGRAEGLEVGMINPSIILGPGYWNHSSFTIFCRIYDGLRFYPVGANGFVDVRDVAEMIALMMKMDTPPPSRMILNSANMSFHDLFAMIAEEMGAKAPSLRVSPMLSEVLWRILKPVEWITGRMPLINRYTARSTQRTVSFSNERSLQIPGFSYRPISQTVADVSKIILAHKEKDQSMVLLDF